MLYKFKETGEAAEVIPAEGEIVNRGVAWVATFQGKTGLFDGRTMALSQQQLDFSFLRV